MTAAATGPGSFRLIPHEPVCPSCGSANVAATDIDMADDTTETAWTCQACGEAWPMACITDWTPNPAKQVNHYA